MSTPKYFLISNKKHFYCREGADLNTDASLVKVSESVSSNFGAKTYIGEVLMISGEYSIMERLHLFHPLLRT